MRIGFVDMGGYAPSGRKYRFEHVAFGSSRHFVDFDIVVWNPELLLKNYIPEYPTGSSMNRGVYERFKQDLERHYAEFDTMLEQGKMVVILVPRPCTFSHESRPASYYETDITQYLPLDNIETAVLSGDRVQVRSNIDEIKLFSEEIQSMISYRAYLSKLPGTPFMYTTANQPVASLIHRKEGYILLLPHINTNGNYIGDRFQRLLDAIVKLKSTLAEKVEPINIPDWADSYPVPQEAESENQISALNREKDEIVGEITKEQARLSSLKELKFLFAGGTGDHLVDLTIKALEELGIHAKDGENNRDDLILSYGDKSGVAEVKGKTKSAAEGDAAQLQKWVSGYYEKHGVEPKGVLIINHFRDLMPEEREEAFPDQMLDYAIRMSMCLITTTQLLQLVLYARENPSQKTEIADSIFSTVGKYTAFESERSDYLLRQES